MHGEQRMAKYPRHPFSTCFPLMTGDSYWELVDDIKQRGLEHDIVLYEGQILDGSNRERACIDAGVEPRYVEYRGNDPLGYVISVNLKRRHLSLDMRAFAATRLATYLHGGDRTKAPGGALSRADAAKLLDVGERSVDRAAAVLESGDADLVTAVEGGDVSLTRAEELAKLSKEQRADALKDLKSQPRKRTTPEQRDRTMTREERLTESEIAGLSALYELGAESEDPRCELGATVLRKIAPMVTR